MIRVRSGHPYYNV